MIIDTLNNPILITGVQRSGATIIAKIISMCGAYTGQTTGMLENIKIKAFIEAYYNSLRIDKKAQFPLPNTQELLVPVNWKKSILEQLDSERIKKADIQQWMFKSSTNCQLWPIWNYAFPNAKWIIVRRRTGDIINSCLQTAYMNAFKNVENQALVGVKSEQEGWLWWVRQHEKLFIEMLETGLNCKIIWPERMANGDYTQIFEMLEWIGLKWNDSIIKTIDPLLYHSKQKERR